MSKHWDTPQQPLRNKMDQMTVEPQITDDLPGEDEEDRTKPQPKPAQEPVK